MPQICAFATAVILSLPCLFPATAIGAEGEPSSQQTQDLPAGFRIDRDSWETPVEPGQSIQIENLYGDVRARRNEIPRLDVFVIIQLQEHDPVRPDVRIIETLQGLKVDVRYVARETGDKTERAGGATERMDSPEDQPGFIRRVDMTVYVPAGSALNVRTAAGTIEARELRSDVVADTTHGEITIITEGSARARSESGSLLAVLLSDETASSSRLETVTGHITLQVPNDLNVLVRVRTGGEITSEYVFEPSSKPGDRSEVMVTLIGAGTHEIEVESDTGNVEILAWLRDGTDFDIRH